MGKKRVLIVEDEGIVARDIADVLTRLGYEIAGIAHSGAEAVRKVQEEKPDLVLMDIVLQGKLDGIETAARVREQSDLPVVYLTAHAEGDVLERAGVTEPYGYILKPFRERELHTAIEMAFYKHAADRERETLIRELRESLARVKTLEGLLPICSHCKKIRDDGGKWHEVSLYISNHSGADFTHGICPDCLQAHYESLEEADS